MAYSDQKFQEFLKALEEVAGPEKTMRFKYIADRFASNAKSQWKISPQQKPDYLSPEVIRSTAKNLFMPQVMQSANAPFQTAVNTVRGLSARAGLLESPYALQAEAGLRGQQTGGAIQEAFSRAIQHGQARASAQTGGGNLMTQFPPVYGTEILGPLKQAFGTYAAYRGYQGAPQASPYSFQWQGSNNQFQIPNQQQYFPVPR